MDAMKFEEVVRDPSIFAGWLYMKGEVFSLDSDVLFYVADKDLSPEDEKKVRNNFLSSGWAPKLSAEDIEDIILNVYDQLEQPSESELVDAINYYFTNDAFKAF